MGKKSKFRFMAMSKLIGLVAILLVFIVTVYSMYEMHINSNFDALNQLIVSVCAFATIYVGFYLTMAKMEHIEEEKTKREKELMSMQKKNATEEDLEFKRNEIELLRQKMNEILGEPTQML